MSGTKLAEVHVRPLMRFCQEIWKIMNLSRLNRNTIPASGESRDVRSFTMIRCRFARIIRALAPKASLLRWTPLTHLVASAMLLAIAPAASASEIKVLSANVFAGVLDVFVGEFERSSGYRVAIVYGTAGNISSRVQSGEAGDVAIVTRPMIDQL